MKEFTAVIESLDPRTRETLLAIIAWRLGIARATMYRRLQQPDAFDPNDWEMIVGVLNVHIRPITQVTYTINQFSHETPTHLEPVPDTSVSGNDAHDPGLRAGIGMDSHEEESDPAGQQTGQPANGSNQVAITHD